MMKLWTRRTKLCRKSRMSFLLSILCLDSSVYNFILCNERKEFFSLLHEKVWLLTIVKFTFFPLFKRPLPAPGSEGREQLHWTRLDWDTCPGLEGLNNVAARSHLCNQVDGVAGILRKRRSQELFSI